VKPFSLESVLSSVNRALERKSLEREDEGYRQSLEYMADQRTRQLQAAMKRTELTYDDTLEALAAALDLRDDETAGHSRRVTGYPQGLVAEEIPLAARIFAVADTLDAMTSDRPYRRALPYAAARAEITRESGRQFGPRAVKAFLSIPEARFETIRGESLHRVTNMHATGSKSPCLVGEANIQMPPSVKMWGQPNYEQIVRGKRVTPF